MKSCKVIEIHIAKIGHIQQKLIQFIKKDYYSIKNFGNFIFNFYHTNRT